MSKQTNNTDFLLCKKNIFLVGFILVLLYNNKGINMLKICWIRDWKLSATIFLWDHIIKQIKYFNTINQREENPKTIKLLKVFLAFFHIKLYLLSKILKF